MRARSRRRVSLRLTRRLLTDLRIVIRELPGDGRAREDPRVRLASRSITELYVVMAVAMTGWIVYLALALPQRNLNQHYDITWVGFDCFLLLTIAATAWHASRLDPRVTLAANATATLLFVDAWMDITTSSSTGALLTAIAFAVLLEIPVAVISLRIARTVTRSLAGRAAQGASQSHAAPDADADATAGTGAGR